MKTVSFAVVCLSLVLGSRSAMWAGGTSTLAGGSETWSGETDMWAGGTAAPQDESRSASAHSSETLVSESKIGFQVKLRAPAGDGITTRRNTNGKEKKRCIRQLIQPWQVAWNRRTKSTRNAKQRKKAAQVNYPHLIIHDSVVNKGKNSASLYMRENIDVNKYTQPKADKTKKLSKNNLLAIRKYIDSDSSKAGRENPLNHDSSSVMYALPFGSKYKLPSRGYIASILFKPVNSKVIKAVDKRLGETQNVSRQANENGRYKLFQSYRQENTKENVPEIRQLPIGIHNKTTSTLKMMNRDMSLETTGHNPILDTFFDTIQAVQPIKITMPLNKEKNDIMNASTASTRQTTDSSVLLGLNSPNWPSTAERIQRRTFGMSGETNIASDESIINALRDVLDTFLDLVETIYYGDDKSIMRLANSRNTHFTDGDGSSLENRSDRQMKPLLRPVINGILDRFSQLRSDIGMYREENKRIKLERQDDPAKMELYSSKYGPKRTFARSVVNNKFSLRDKSNINFSEEETENQDDMIPNHWDKLKKVNFYKLAIELSKALSNIILEYEKTSKVDTENNTDSSFLMMSSNISHKMQIIEKIDLFKSNETNLESKDIQEDNTVHKPPEYHDGISSLPSRLGVPETETVGPIMIRDSHVTPNTKENIGGRETVSSNSSIFLLGIPIVPDKNESKPLKGDGAGIETIDNDDVVKKPTTNHVDSSSLLGIPIVSGMEKSLTFMNDESYMKPKGENFIVEHAVALPDGIGIPMGTPRILGQFEIGDANMKEKFHANSVKTPEEQLTDINSHLWGTGLSVIDSPRYSVYEDLKTFNTISKQKDQADTLHKQTTTPEEKSSLLGIPRNKEREELISFTSDDVNKEEKYQNIAHQENIEQSKVRSSLLGITGQSEFELLGSVETEEANVESEYQDSTLLRQTTHSESNSSFLGFARGPEYVELRSIKSDETNMAPNQQNPVYQIPLAKSEGSSSSLLDTLVESGNEELQPIKSEEAIVEPKYHSDMQQQQMAKSEGNSSLLGIPREPGNDHLGLLRTEDTHMEPKYQGHEGQTLQGRSQQSQLGIRNGYENEKSGSMETGEKMKEINRNIVRTQAAQPEDSNFMVGIPRVSGYEELRSFNSEEAIMKSIVHQTQKTNPEGSNSSLLGMPRATGYDNLGLLRTEDINMEQKNQKHESEQSPGNSLPLGIQNKFENEVVELLETGEKKMELNYQNNSQQLQTTQMDDSSSTIGSPRASGYEELRTFYRDDTISEPKDQNGALQKQITTPEGKISPLVLSKESDYEELDPFKNDDGNKKLKLQNNFPQENTEQSEGYLIGNTGESENELLGSVKTEETNMEPNDQNSTLLRLTAQSESKSSLLGITRDSDYVELRSFKTDETNLAPNYQNDYLQRPGVKSEGSRSSLLDSPRELGNEELSSFNREETIMELKDHSNMQQKETERARGNSSILGIPGESDYLGLLKTEDTSTEQKGQTNILLGTSEQPEDSLPFSIQNWYENGILGSLVTGEKKTESKYQNNITEIHELETIKNDKSNVETKHKKVALQSPAKTDNYIVLELSGEDPYTIQKGFTEPNINDMTDLPTGKLDNFTSAETLMRNITDKVTSLKYVIKDFDRLGLVKEELQEETNVGDQPLTMNDSMLTDVVLQGSNNGTDSFLSKLAGRDKIIDLFNKFVDRYIDYKMAEKSEDTNNLKQNNMTYKLNNISDEWANIFRKYQELKYLVETVTLVINAEFVPNVKTTKSLKEKIENILSNVKTYELPELLKIAIKFLLEPFGLSGKLENVSDSGTLILDNSLLESVDSISNKKMKPEFQQINHSVDTGERLVLKTPGPLKSVNDKDTYGAIQANTTSAKLDKGWGEMVTHVGKEILHTDFNLTHNKEHQTQDNPSRQEGNKSLKSLHTKEVEQLSQPKVYKWGSEEGVGRVNIRREPCKAHPVTHLCVPLHSAQVMPTVSDVMDGQLYLQHTDRNIPFMLNYGMFRTVVPNMEPSSRNGYPIGRAEGLPRVKNQPIALALTGHDKANADLDIEDYSHSELNNTPDNEKSVGLSSRTGNNYAKNGSKNKKAVKLGHKRHAATEGTKMDVNGQFNNEDGRNYYATKVNNEAMNRENYYFLKGKPISSQNKVESDNKSVNYFSSDSNRKTISASKCYMDNSKPHSKNIILGESQEEMENSNGTLTEPAYGVLSKSPRHVKVNLLELKDLKKANYEDSRAVIIASGEIVGNHGAFGEISYKGGLKRRRLDKGKILVSTTANEKTEILRDNGNIKESVSEYKLISLSENVANKTENQTSKLITQKQLQPYDNHEIPGEVQSKSEALETDRNIHFTIFNVTQKSIIEPVPLPKSINNILNNFNIDFHLNSTNIGKQHNNVANNDEKSRHTGGMKPKRDCRSKRVDNCAESQIIKRLKEMYVPQTQNELGKEDTETSTPNDSMSSDLVDESDYPMIQYNELKPETIQNCRTKEFENQGRVIDGYAIGTMENISGNITNANFTEGTFRKRMAIIIEILRAIKDWLILAV